MKKNDIVKFKLDITGDMQQGRVNWIDGENVGITLIGNGYSGKEATVMPVSECEVVVEYKGDTLKDEIHSLTTEDLIANIQRLKGMRFPRKMTRGVRTVSARAESKKKKMTRLLEALEEDPNMLDVLINKALNEGKEGDKANGD